MENAESYLRYRDEIDRLIRERDEAREAARWMWPRLRAFIKDLEWQVSTLKRWPWLKETMT